MWQIIKTIYTVLRSNGTHRTTEGRALRCKVCGDVFTNKEKAKAHKHEVR
jgi:hypothetical protein